MIVTAGWANYPLGYDDDYLHANIFGVIVTAGWAIHPLGIYDFINNYAYALAGWSAAE